MKSSPGTGWPLTISDPASCSMRWVSYDGTGARTRILSTAIEKMVLVHGLGQIRELDAQHEPELFSSARVNLGSLGVVTEITFNCVKAFDLEERLELLDFDTALADLDGYLANNDYCKFHWLAYTDKVQVYTFNKTDNPRGGFGLTGLMDRTGISGFLFTGLMGWAASRRHLFPFYTIRFSPSISIPTGEVDRSDRVIKVSSSIPIHQETEYAYRSRKR